MKECGVQPLTQYSMVGATTFQCKIMILLCITLRIISDSVFSVLVVKRIHKEAYDMFKQILVD